MANNQQLLLGEGAGSAPAVFVEDVFSTYLYTGNGSTQTITNDIDLSTKGGLVWLKIRTSAGSRHQLTDTVRGATKYLQSDISDAEGVAATGLTSFSSTGFAIGANADYNVSSGSFVSWTFRKQPKFFDIVTYTGTGAVQNIAHNLGSVPGMVIVKITSGGGSWYVYHRSNANTQAMLLNGTQAAFTDVNAWNSTTPTSSVFTVGVSASTNNSGSTYVAYLFAHDAGGFGLAGTDNVISCGSFTATGNDTINLGFEPQWLLMKRVNTIGNWSIDDTMRGFSLTGDRFLNPNLSDAESAGGGDFPTATGFEGRNYGSGTVIYIAIRRGPMKVPTVGTSVFSPVARNATGAVATVTAGFAPDLLIAGKRGLAARYATDKLRGRGLNDTSTTGAEQTTATDVVTAYTNTGITLGADSYGYGINSGTGATIDWFFGRAPGFFDEVCYTGTGSATTQAHNLGVAPEMIIVKKRSGATYWPVRYSSAASSGYGMYLNDTGVEQNTVSVWTTTAPTSAVFSIGASGDSNASAATYVAYLFATCAGVSKVGSYTGNGSSQTIACGFTAGSRFVMIKRTDSTGDWYVWDSARGIIAGNDPHLSLNTTAAEVTTDDSVDTDNSGFIVNQLSATNVNVSSASYIFLAVS